MKSIVIAGANKGLSFETAKRLASLGYFVYVGTPDKAKGLEAVEKLKALGFSNADYLELDVTSLNSIKNARAALEVKTQQLAVQTNKAGTRDDLPQPAKKVSIYILP